MHHGPTSATRSRTSSAESQGSATPRSGSGCTSTTVSIRRRPSSTLTSSRITTPRDGRGSTPAGETTRRKGPTWRSSRRPRASPEHRSGALSGWPPGALASARSRWPSRRPSPRGPTPRDQRCAQGRAAWLGWAVRCGPTGGGLRGAGDGVRCKGGASSAPIAGRGVTAVVLPSAPARSIIASVAWTLDLSPVVQLKRRLSRAAFFTGLTVYLEGVVAFVLLTEEHLSPAAAVAIVPVLTAQVVVIRRPAQQLLQGRLVRGYRRHLSLALVFLALLALGAAGGEAHLSLIMGLLVVAPFSLPAVTAMRVATQMRPRLEAVADPGVLLAWLSFDPRLALVVKLRSVGGGPVRWAAPAVAGGLAMAATAALLALLLGALGVNVPGAGIAQASGVVGVLIFYRAMRYAKVRASELRAHDLRPPVLLLRRFDDDALGTGWINRATFEHTIASDLNRIGPTISVGRPGERLQPLGASRDYLIGDDWKSAVDRLIHDAAAVVFVLGDSDSLVWEFKTTRAAHRGRRTLVLVPPLKTRGELERRWEAFVVATADSLGPALPRALPADQVLGVCFAGADPVMIMSRERVGRGWSALSRTRPDYRLALRLFEGLVREPADSSAALQAFIDRHVPILSLSTGVDPGEKRQGQGPQK